MGAKIGAKSAGLSDGQAQSERIGFGALAVATLLVALVYGGTLVWLFLADNRLAGEPVVRLALAVEETVETPVADETDVNADDDIAATVPEISDELSDEEQALVDAARRLEESTIAEDVASQVRIVGAESVSGGDTLRDTAPPIVLPPVPDPALVENSAQGPLPKIAPDGRRPYQVYARPVPAGTPATRRVAIVVSGMGISESATAHAIETLPPEVTLSFAPYGPNLQDWISKARAAGHEVLLELPMEPFGYPQNDPGPYTLLTSLSPEENLTRLEWLMSRFTGYAGVMNYQGARFTTSVVAVEAMIGTLKARGLFYVDNGASARSVAPQLARDAGMPVVLATRIIDPVQNPQVIATSLDVLEEVAADGVAIGVASGFPVTVDAVAKWAATLGERNFVLVPVTAVAN
ncbi:MAG: divergent polysaccharide deacetylase family protein [Parvibaculum sp.]|uniref:divergent polysaccharide deacetylase family protein n=1 Tax=Parvibaculum sp. TaxID=2024848 RepID=UPI00271CBDF4|nr:divergent polysaccharide deacetylase family protein [Parvibaculum sp.]MDO8837774.1 divergent polysaccharide deacetylase family protein [Parvibaculum sp.]